MIIKSQDSWTWSSPRIFSKCIVVPGLEKLSRKTFVPIRLQMYYKINFNICCIAMKIKVLKTCNYSSFVFKILQRKESNFRNDTLKKLVYGLLAFLLWVHSFFCDGTNINIKFRNFFTKCFLLIRITYDACFKKVPRAKLNT